MVIHGFRRYLGISGMLCLSLPTSLLLLLKGNGVKVQGEQAWTSPDYPQPSNVLPTPFMHFGGYFTKKDLQKAEWMD